MLNYLEISKTALKHNARSICEYVKCPVIGVVKCDGYGLTVKEAAKVWQEQGVKMFAVSEYHEALELREAGFKEDILLLVPVGDRETLLNMLKADVILTVSSEENARFYSENCDGMRVRVHVAIDTGMGRFGPRWTDTDQLLRIYSTFNFQFEGVFSHFSASFEQEYNLTKIQLQRFLSAVDVIQNAGINVGMRHIANSSAALRFPETRLDAVRIGSALVGELVTSGPVSLKKVGMLKAQVVDVKDLKSGDTISYASVCKVKRDTKAVVVAIGFECGFGYNKGNENLPLRHLASAIYHMVRDHKNPPYVMYGDKRLKLVGRVGSQYSMFDATGIDINPGQYVTAKPKMLFPHKRRKFV